MADVKCEVIMTLIPRSGCWRCNMIGMGATNRSAKENTRANRAMSFSSLMPKTWYSDDSTKAPATSPVMKGYITIWTLQ